MSTTARFSSAASNAGATVHVVPRVDAAEQLEKLVDRPGVGAPLPIDGVSLPDEVNTDPDESELQSAKTGITVAPLGIESLGSVVVFSDEKLTGPISLFPERQIAVVDRENIVEDVETAFSRLAERFWSSTNDAVIVTGPSSTGDMGALVTGVHGPAELHIVVIDDE